MDGVWRTLGKLELHVAGSCIFCGSRLCISLHCSQALIFVSRRKRICTHLTNDLSGKRACEHDVRLVGGSFNRNKFHNRIVVGANVIRFWFRRNPIGARIGAVLDLRFRNGCNPVNVGPQCDVMTYLNNLAHARLRCKDAANFASEGVVEEKGTKPRALGLKTELIAPRYLILGRRISTQPGFLAADLGPRCSGLEHRPLPQVESARKFLGFFEGCRVRCMSWRNRVPSKIQRMTVNSNRRMALSPLTETDVLRLALQADDAILYSWSLEEDRIEWDDALHSLLDIEDTDVISSGAGYCKYLDANGVSAREDLRTNESRDFSIFKLEYKFQTIQGDECWLEDRGQRLFSEEGKPTRIVGVVRVITGRKLREAKLSYLATYDELTGHLNRSQLRDRLDQLLSNLVRANGQGAYLIAGINDLSIINGDYGFDVADEVIIGVGERIRSCIKESDLVGRCSGNKFGIVLAETSPEQMSLLAERIVDRVGSSAIATTAGPIPTTISMGCVSLPNGVGDAEKAMIHAEEALDQAKHSAQSRISIFNKSAKTESIRKRNAFIADQVVSALNDRRIKLAFQPIVCASTLEVDQYECLIRMVEPDGSVVPAGDFIPVAEELGLIRLLDRRVLELVVECLHDNPDVNLALNVSGMTATESACLEGYIDHLEANRGIANRLTVELTETSAIRDLEESARFLTRLRNLGCQIAIDDFGAGYTSFRNLQALVVDSVKIDGAFIRGLESSQDNQLFVRTLVDLAKNFELETVAEWVGNAQQAELLRQYGVDYLQGFFIGEPKMDLNLARPGGKPESEPLKRSA